MENTIWCTYLECHQQFASREDMKAHKAGAAKVSDKIHDFYCRKCDEDCVDDAELFMHQLLSHKHLVCPACGLEFKSQGGRTLHMHSHHNEIESIACVGCNHEFDDVASLCEHVKTTRCEAIKAKYLRKQLERSKRASGSAATSNQS